VAFLVEGRRVTVAGGATSGVAAAELLVRRRAVVTLSDVRREIPDGARLRAGGVRLELGGHRVETFLSADLVVLSPGVRADQPVVAAARAAGVPVIGEVELASRWLRGRVIAITGTKGKSTTTSLAGRMLAEAGFKVSVSGNIGDPLSGKVESSTSDTIHVVETSSFQLEQTDTFHPWIAVLLNLSPDHLDRHGTIEAYRLAKTRIFRNQQPEDWAVVNADDPAVLEMAARGLGRQRPFARRAPIEEGTAIQDGWIGELSTDRFRPLVPLAAIHLIGPHLVDDVMAAATVGAILGASPSAMTAAVEAFRGLDHAMELVASIGGVRFVNDSKATNIEAAARAIESFDSGVVPIIGGRYKGGDFERLREPARARARAVVTIGEAAPLVRRALEDTLEVRHAASMRQAVTTAFALAEPHGVVLLAPACASFDMFEDYADRGRAFRREVARLMRRGEEEGESGSLEEL